MYILLAVIGLMVLVFIVWRLASRRRSLPCPVWLRWFVELDNPLARTNRAAVIIEHLDLQAGMTVLDAGCGPGRVTLPLARQVGPQGRVVAMDIQRGMLERVRDKAQDLNNIELLEGGLGEGRLDGGRFDRVVLVTVLGEIPGRKAAMEEIFAALKPGGVLSVTEIVFDPHYQRRQTVTGLAAAAGFREKAFYGNRLAYTLNFQRPEN